MTIVSPDTMLVDVSVCTVNKETVINDVDPCVNIVNVARADEIRDRAVDMNGDVKPDYAVHLKCDVDKGCSVNDDIIQQLVQLHELVDKSNMYNFEGLRMKVPSTLNKTFWLQSRL